MSDEKHAAWWKKHRGTVGQVAVVAAVFFGIRALTQRGIASGAAPALAGADLAGQALSLSAHEGKPVVVHFWATWCSVCQAEAGNVDSFARDHALVTVASGSGEAAEIRADMEKRGVSFPVVVDADGSIARRWGVRAFPTTFFLAADHQIRFAETGYTSGPGFRLRSWLTGS